MKNRNVFVFARMCMAAALALMAAETAWGSSQSWTGSSTVNGNWSTGGAGGNWGVNAAPGATTGLTSADLATFSTAISNSWGSSAGNPVVVDANRNIKSITFNANGASLGNFFIGSVGGNALLLTSAGTIQINNGTNANPTETVNAPLVVEGANGTYSFLNSRPHAAASLVLGGQISGGAAGNTVVTFGGSATPTMNYVYGNIVDGSSTLGVKQTAGNWTYAGTNTYSGGTTLAGGVFRAQDGVSLPAASNLTITAGVYQETGTNFTRALGTGDNQVQITGGTSGFSAYTNPLTINLGSVGAALAWGSALFAPSTLVLNEASAAASLTLINGIDLNNASHTLNVNASIVTITGPVIDSGTNLFYKGGAGTLILTGNNTFNSNVIVSAGTLALSGTNTFGYRLTVNNGSTGLFAGGKTTLQSLIPQASGVVTQYAGTVILANGSDIRNSQGMYYISGGVFSNAAGAFRGTKMEASGDAEVCINAPTYARIASDNQNGILKVSGNARVTILQNLVLTGPAVATACTGTVTLAGGTLTVPGVDNSAGSLTNQTFVNFNGGTLRFAAAATVVANDYSKFNVLESGAVIDTGTNGVTNNQPFVTGVAGTDGGLTKQGAGRLTLASTNTYSGDTVISAGTLKLGAALSISNTPLIAVASGATCDVTSVTGFTVYPAQTLAGSGTVAGNVILQGALAPGGTNAVGALRVTSALTLQSGAALKWDHNGATADVVNVSGTLTLPANATVNVSGTGSLPARAVLFTAPVINISGASDLSGWTVTGPGIGGNSRAMVTGTEVLLVTSQGTLVEVQ